MFGLAGDRRFRHITRARDHRDVPRNAADFVRSKVEGHDLAITYGRVARGSSQASGVRDLALPQWRSMTGRSSRAATARRA
jgi:hypothetical protein